MPSVAPTTSVMQPTIAAPAAPGPAPQHVVDGPVPSIAPATAAEVPDVPAALQAHLMLVRRS